MRTTFSLASLLAIAAVLALAGCQCKSNGTKTALKNKGEACDTDNQCITGLCDAPPGKDKSCLTKCTSGCDSTEVCILLGPSRYGCVPHGHRAAIIYRRFAADWPGAGTRHRHHR